MSFNFFNLKKLSYDYIPLIKICRQSNSRHEHIPSTLAECLDRTSNTRREYWRFWLIILLILPTLYYINDLLKYEKSKFVNRETEQDDVLIKRPSKNMHLNPPSQVVHLKRPQKDMDLKRPPKNNFKRPLKDTALTRPSKVVANTAFKMIKTAIKKEVTTRVSQVNLPICNVNNSLLGKFFIKWPLEDTDLDNQYPMISKGGYYSPVGCQSRHRVGILVPYRDREENLSVFIYNIHPFLMKQKLEYRIFLVEQKGTEKFNKGRLFNAGFEEMKKYGPWHCIVFHDVDLIPVDERILYSCPYWPRHMCAISLQDDNETTYQGTFGGVATMTPAQYETVNGYSNLYWGWGGEDQDMFWRLHFAGLHMTRYSKTIAMYYHLLHPKPQPNQLRYLLLHEGPSNYKQEGLSTLEYKLVSVTERPLYTHIVVDINPARKINPNLI